MTAINFPLNPTIDQVYEFSGRSWIWNGRSWRSISTFVGYTGSQGIPGEFAGVGFTGSQGFTGSAGTSGSNGNRSVMLAQEGLLVVRTGVSRWYAPADLTILEITYRLSEPADQIATIVINKNGIATRTINMPIGDVKAVNSESFSMTVDDYLTVDVLSAGSPGLTTQGSGLNVVFLYAFTDL